MGPIRELVRGVGNLYFTPKMVSKGIVSSWLGELVRGVSDLYFSLQFEKGLFIWVTVWDR